MGRIIRNGIEYGSGGTASNVVYLTQEAYDALPDNKLTDGVEYRITDANTDSTKARNIAYDGSASGLEATSVQGAIDALAGGSLANKEIKVASFSGTTNSTGDLKIYTGFDRIIIAVNCATCPVRLVACGEWYITAYYWAGNVYADKPVEGVYYYLDN